MGKESSFQLIMISAMYENGGNTLQRFLDGHPRFYVYPFESQLGNNLFTDHFSSLFPFKYRWPDFPLSGNSSQDYELFYDEELKTRIRRPQSSKFREFDIKLNEAKRKKLFINFLKNKRRSRSQIIEAFFRSTFDSWENLKSSGREKTYVGYSPIIAVDAAKIIADFPNAHVVHIVRNPYSAYAETKHRPFPLSLEYYILGWNIVQYLAITNANRFPKNVHVVRYEDLIKNPPLFFKKLCLKIGFPFVSILLYPSWNGISLKEVYPWGTIHQPTIKENLERRNELSDIEKTKIKLMSVSMLRHFKYE